MGKELEKNLDYLYERRERLDRERFKLSNVLDRYIFAASTGALALLVSLTRTIGSIEYTSLFLLAALLFIFSIITTLLSIQFSVKAYKKQMDITDQEINLLQGDSKEICRDNFYNLLVKYTSIISEILFVAGALITVIFYYLNI